MSNQRQSRSGIVLSTLAGYWSCSRSCCCRALVVKWKCCLLIWFLENEYRWLRIQLWSSWRWISWRQSGLWSPRISLLFLWIMVVDTYSTGVRKSKQHFHIDKSIVCRFLLHLCWWQYATVLWVVVVFVGTTSVNVKHFNGLKGEVWLVWMCSNWWQGKDPSGSGPSTSSLSLPKYVSKFLHQLFSS